MIDVRHKDGIALVTLRHGKVNALDIEFCAAIAACFDKLRVSDAKAVVLTGQGGCFSAGVDLIRVSRNGSAYIRQFLPALRQLYEAVFFHPKPVVAAVNGHAIAGGAVLAACADRRIMARGVGRIGVTELLVGVPFPALAFEVLRFALPPNTLAEDTLSGATYAGDDALERGWVDALAAPEALPDQAMKAAQVLAALSSVAFMQTKMQLREGARERLAASEAATDKTVTEIWCAPEAMTNIRDYVARTLKKK